MLSPVSANRIFEEKAVLCREQGRVEQVFLIRRGMVKLLSYLPNGRARIVRLHTPGHWLGLEGLVGRPYEHTAVALDEVEVTCLSTARLRLLEQDDPQQFCQVLKQGYRNLAQADRWIADFSTGGIRPRVARLVAFISTITCNASSDLVELLTVHEMADMLGVTPESVSRVLAEFKRNHLLDKVAQSPGQVYRIDAQRLHHEAQQ